MFLQVLERALEAWHAGRPVRAGELLFEALDDAGRVGWALGILRVATAGRAVPEEVSAVLAIGLDHERWREAHAAFCSVRRLTLAAERAGTSRNELEYCLLFVAENTAKVLYNASGEPAPFDHHAGWRLPSNAQAMIDLDSTLRDPFEKAILDVR